MTVQTLRRDGSGSGQLVANIMHFARTLRAAGFAIGPGRVLDAISAVRAVGIANRRDFYWTLHAVFVNRPDQRELFDQAFHIFWRNPRMLERMMALLLPSLVQPEPSQWKKLSRRLTELLYAGANARSDQMRQPPQLELDATFTWSAEERLQTKDFEAMTAEEITIAKAAVTSMRLPLHRVATRRFRVHPHGLRIDMRATLRAALRAGKGTIPLLRKRRRDRQPPLVIVCDISGSMSRYSRMLLHFAHIVTNRRDRVHTFVFGTRLTNVTRYLREKDVDVALDRVADAVQDWSGGTRIGHCLHQFNRSWSRRVLAQGAIVLLITDGLDRDTGAGLAREMERLHKSCRRLIWLNPLLRYEHFEPKAIGIKAMLPHVDDFRTVHNLVSLAELTNALSRSAPRHAEGVTHWVQRQTSDCENLAQI
ncbi:MAG: VWA domain-containing protein [Acidiferrobacterales bacterium]